MNKTSSRLFAAAVTLIGVIAPPAKADMPKQDASDTAFAAALYHRLAPTKGNLLFSPFSIRTALGMTYAGAAGNTASQIKTVLGFPADAANVDQLLGDAAKKLNRPQDDFTLAIADSLWGEKTFPFDPAFTARLVDRFDADLHQTDFAAAPEAARADIDRWVGLHTADKIPDLFPPGSIDSGTDLVLANAVYLKAKWATPFEPSATRPMPFHLDASHEVSTAAMHATLQGVPYVETGDLRIVDLPYRGGQLSMTLLVPKAIDGLSKVESRLDAATLQTWLPSMQPRTVRLSLPKLKLDGAFDLSDALSAMGMPDAFDRHKADFTGMVAPNKPMPAPLYIGRVLHRAMADVDEEGTEAAAATGIEMRVSASMRRPQDEAVVTADRPFILLIRHRESGAILFVGRVSDPR